MDPLLAAHVKALLLKCSHLAALRSESQSATYDAGQGSITVPGSMAATPVEGPIDVEEGMPIDLPLVFYYGHQTPTENPELYRAVVERMSSILDERVRPLPVHKYHVRPRPELIPKLGIRAAAAARPLKNKSQ